MIVQESVEQSSYISHRALTSGRNQSSGLISLQVKNNRTLELAYGYFNKRITINSNDLRERLLGKVYSGVYNKQF